MGLEIIGILGGLLAFLAFVEVASGKWDGKSFNYEFCNVVASALLGWYAFQKHAYTNIVLNLVWGIFALYVLLHVTKRHKIRKRVVVKKSRKKARV